MNSPVQYDRAVDHWYRTDGAEGVEPLPPELDGDLNWIRVAKELGLDPERIATYPAHWVAASMTLMAWENVEHRKQERKHRPTKATEVRRKTGGRGA